MHASQLLHSLFGCLITLPGRVIFHEEGSSGTKRSTTLKIKVTFLIRLVFKPLLFNLAKTHVFIIPLQWIHVKKKIERLTEISVLTLVLETAPWM